MRITLRPTATGEKPADQLYNTVMSRRYLMVAVALALGSGCGCTSHFAHVSVEQAHLSGGQRIMDLTTESADFAATPIQQRYIFRFPLPGSRLGPPKYHLYLCCPSGEGVFEGTPSTGAVSGFFEQLSGKYAGRTPLESARIEIDGENDTREGALHVTCEDGTRIYGRFRAQRNTWGVRDFEEQQLSTVQP
jgi:hypothetical protein